MAQQLRDAISGAAPRGGISGSGLVFKTLSSQAAALGAEISSQLDAAASKMATDKGLDDFMAGKFKERTGTGLFTKAYNASGLAANAAAGESLMETTLSALAARHKGDPDGFQQAATKFRSDFETTLERSNRATGLLQYDANAAKVFGGLQSALAADVRAGQLATITNRMGEVKGQVLQSLRSGNHEQALAQAGAYQQWMVAARPLGMTLAQYAERTNELAHEMQIAMKQGDVIAAVNSNNGFAFLAKLESERATQSTFTPAEFDDLLDFTRSSVNNHYALLDKVNTAQDRAIDLAAEKNFKGLFAAALAGEDISAALATAQVLRTLKTGDYEKLAVLNNKLLTEGRDDNQQIDTAMLLFEQGQMSVDAARNLFLNMSSSGDIQRATLAQALGRIDARGDRQVTNPRYRASQREMLVAIGYDPDAGMPAMFTSDQSHRVFTGMTMFRQLVEDDGMRPEQARDITIAFVRQTKGDLQTLKSTAPDYPDARSIWEDTTKPMAMRQALVAEWLKHQARAQLAGEPDPGAAAAREAAEERKRKVNRGQVPKE
jgi:hypothetical protein